MVVENKAGGLGSVTSIETVKSAEAERLHSARRERIALLIMPTLYKKPPFDTANDFVPVSAAGHLAERAGGECEGSGAELEGIDPHF